MSDLITGYMSRRGFIQGVGAAGAAAASPSNPWSHQIDPTANDQPHPMRSPSNRPAHASSIVTPPVSVIALNRMGFGPRPGDLDDFMALGSTDDARLNAYIDQQLDPASILDSELDSRMATAAFTTLDKTLAQLWNDHYVNYIDYSYAILPITESERATFLRAIYSRRQLVQVLADFWHNHFNLYGWTFPTYSLFPYYDRDIIRAHLLGNFRQMLEAVAKSTTMLYYLDNYTSSRAGPNENWSRELFELHTLGAENYLGVGRQSDVPLDPQGLPVGYVDDDVYETTRCFTGWTVANSDSSPGGNTGLFLYRDDWHDRFQKTTLGQFIPADQFELKDGEDVLDALAAHPGTARHICRKLCRRFITDHPPNSLVQSAADIFLANKNAPDQIKQVMSHILRSTEFRTTWGSKVKRPFEAVVSALRAADADFTIMVGDGDSDSFLYYYGATGQDLFSWRAPNGYPDYKEDWQTTSSLLYRWRTINWLVTVTDDADNYRLDVLSQTPGNVLTPNELADFWIDRILGRPLSSFDR
jgi:uncharacterized protein (DUF1800 family)